MNEFENNLSYEEIRNINLTDDYIIESNYSEDLAKISMGGLYGFIDFWGTIKIPIEYEQADLFHNGLAIVKNIDNRYGIIDKYNRTVIPFKYKKILKFNENSFRVKLNNYWGILTKENIIQIPIKYNYISNPMMLSMLVKVDNKWGVIGIHGEIIIPIQFRFDDVVSLIDPDVNVDLGIEI